MKGTTILVSSDDKTPLVVTEHTSMPKLDFLRDCVGGSIQLVPYFTSIMHEGRRHKCVAFCNKDGKLPPLCLPVNHLANKLWNETLRRDHNIASHLPDFLVGNILIVFGDESFMREL